MRILYSAFSQQRNPPQIEYSQLQTQMVETEIRRIKAFHKVIIISLYKCEATRMLRDNFLISLVNNGEFISRNSRIPDLMFRSLGWNNEDKVLVLQSPVKLLRNSTLQLIGQIKGSDSQWVREITVS